ncbi:hypothetical protein HHI36_015710 [Cryptolaemus montrouzieri]|uniref:Voltage-dependent anion-selective channel n=1 Tax=Cryptolaemus montrouzieri TaxID=559131 RepID=A0ABD2N6I0_9CUCU
MAPPPYSDLGKRSRDVFGRGYHFGLIKLDVKTKTAAGVEFNTSGASNQETGKVNGSLETKYRVKEYGLTFSEKWNTDNTLTTGIELKDQLAQGLKIALEGDFSPQTGFLGVKLCSNFDCDINSSIPSKLKFEFRTDSASKSGALKTAFQNEYVALNADADLNVNGPIIQASAVVGHQGWLAGYQTAFDTAKSKLTKNNFALGFSTGDFILHTNVDDGQEFGGAIFQKINNRLETGVNLAWSAGSNNTKFGIGAKYDLDLDASLRAKINNQSQIGLGYQQKLREGITLTLSALIDGKNFNNGGHKVGLALELEA